MKIFFKSLVVFYRVFLSPFIGGQCRFYPTCSSHALEALDRLPLLTALWQIGRRLVRCQPFHPGGVDVVALTPIMSEYRSERIYSGRSNGANGQTSEVQMGVSGGERYRPLSFV